MRIPHTLPNPMHPRRRPYVPETVRDYYRDPVRVSGVPFAIVGFGAAIWALSWWGVLVAFFVVALAVLIRTWGEAAELDARVRELEPERDELERQVLQQDGEVAKLRAELDRPQLELPHLVHAVDVLVEQINLVRKHRRLKAAGSSDWPVTAAAVVHETGVRLVAHATDPTRVGNEPVAVIDPATQTAFGIGTISPAGESAIEVEVEFTALPASLQDQAIRDRRLDPSDFRLRLLGLELRQYANMSDDEIDDLRSKLRTVADTVAERLVPSLSTVELEPPSEYEDSPRNSNH